MAMVALPIAGLSAIAVGIRSARPTEEDQVRAIMGGADLSIDGPWRLTARALDVLPEGTQVVTHRVKESEYVSRASFIYIEAHELSVPIDAEITRGLFTIIDGDAPSQPGEVAVPPEVARNMDVSIGDELFLSDGLALQVTGTVVQPESLGSGAMVVGPGTLEDGKATFLPYLVKLPERDRRNETIARAEAVIGSGTVLARTDASTIAIISEPYDDPVVTNWSFVGTALALACTGLISAAAFVVGTKRQLRGFGLIGAVGGEPRHIRTTVLYGGAVLGATGATAGVMIGIAVAYLGREVIGRLSGRLVESIGLPVMPLVGAIALGTLAATCAAFMPARMAARLTTNQALAAQTPPQRLPGRLALIGLLGVGVGTALTAHGALANATLELTAGLIVSATGFLLAIPLLVKGLGTLVRRMPLTPRLAGRDISRNARRTGSALAAATIALSVPVAIAAFTLSEADYERRLRYLAPDHATIGVLDSSARDVLDESLLSTLERSLPGWDIAPLRLAAFPVERRRQGGGVRVVDRVSYVIGAEQPSMDGESTYQPWVNIVIGGPEVMRVLHAEDGTPALLSGRLVAIGPRFYEGDSVMVRNRPGPGGKVEVPVMAVGGESFEALIGEHTLVMTEAAAAGIGLHASRTKAAPAQIALRAPETLSDSDIGKVKETVGRYPGAYVTTAEDFVDRGGRMMRRGASIAGGVLALAIVGVAVALIAAESRRDQAIMVAVGASPATRRRLAGAGAGMVALLAGILAVPAGWLPVAAIMSVDPRDLTTVVPWTAIVTVLLLVPAIAWLFGWALSRQPTAARLLRPIA